MLEIEVAQHVEAQPAQVWALVGDPTRMGDLSPECNRVEWTKGSTQPKVGATFRGRNRNGWRRWSTSGTLVTYEPEQEIAWDVALGPLDVARWIYRIAPDPGGGGCTVTERFVDHRGNLMVKLGRIGRGVSDTEGHNRAGMEQTLTTIKAAAEHPSPDS